MLLDGQYFQHAIGYHRHYFPLGSWVWIKRKKRKHVYRNTPTIEFYVADAQTITNENMTCENMVG